MSFLNIERITDLFSQGSRYLIIILMVLYTIQSYTVFQYGSAQAKRNVFLRQNVSMFFIHFVAMLVLFLEQRSIQVAVFYGMQAAYLLAAI